MLLALFLGGWAWASGRMLDRLFLSDPVSVARAFWAILLKGTLWYHLRFTLTETLLGYVIGASLGLGGALAGVDDPGRRARAPPLRPAGLRHPEDRAGAAHDHLVRHRHAAEGVLAATFVFFVVFLSTLAGVATVPPQLVSVVRVMGAAPLAVFRKVVVPSALPFILTALRLTIPAALIGAVIGEFISSNRGVGDLINAASSRYATAEVFAGIGSLLVVVLCMNAGLSLLERSWSRWAPRDGLGSQ